MKKIFCRDCGTKIEIETEISEVYNKSFCSNKKSTKFSYSDDGSQHRIDVIYQECPKAKWYKPNHDLFRLVYLDNKLRIVARDVGYTLNAYDYTINELKQL